MKIRFTYLLISVLILSTKICSGQELRISAIAEKTVMGVQAGTEIGYRLKNLLTFGGFYQINVKGNEIHQRMFDYTGGSISFVIARCDNIMIHGVVRGGLSNRRFVIITPGIETELKLTKLLSVNLGMSIRAAEAAISTKLVLNL